MNDNKPYQALIDNHIYLGGANDVQAMVDNEQIQLVVDLREEAGAVPAISGLIRKNVPLGDNSDTPQAPLMNEAIQAVVAAYRAGTKVGFHCGGGKGRTGAVAVGVLLELGICKTMAEAEAQATAIRPVIKIRPEQRQALEQLYPQ